jgi:hypothetical protein
LCRARRFATKGTISRATRGVLATLRMTRGSVSRNSGSGEDNANVHAVAARFRADLRDRWRSWSVLTLLFAMFAGALIAVAAGPPRTDSAMARFERAERAPDEMLFTPPDGGATFATVSAAHLARLPDVEAIASVDGYPIANPADITLIAPTDRALGTTLMRKKILAGRDVDRARAEEVTISFVLAHDHHLHVGDTLHLDAQRADTGADVPLSFHVVGIDATPTEFPPQSGEGVETAWATPAFARGQGRSLAAFQGSAIELRGGAADGAHFEAEVAKLAGGRIAELFTVDDQTVNTQHSIHLQAVALWILGGLLLLAGALVIGQLSARQAHLEAVEYDTLRSMGMTSGELFALGTLRVLAIGVVGAVLAVVIAVAASPLLPVGLARIAEPHPGFALDGRALALGALATVLVVFAISVWSVARESRGGPRERRRTPRPRLRASLQRVPSPSAAMGMTFALERGRGRSSVPVRTTVIAAAVGLLALVTALTFSASLDHLLATPRLYGVTFDAYVASLRTNDVSAAMSTVRSSPGVGDVALGYAGIPFALDGFRVDGIALTTGASSLAPAVTSGRLPSAPDEIALGTRTMASLHLHLGSFVDAQVERGTRARVQVVGTALFPTLSDQLGLGKGALMTAAGLRRTLGPVPAPPVDHVFVRFRPDAPANAFSVLSDRVEKVGSVALLPVQRPTDLVNFGRVQSLPIVLASILSALAALTMAHLLVTSIRRHRTELAVLRAIGCAPKQVRRTVSVQATTLAVLALALAVPLGLLAGRWVWRVFAQGLGVSAGASAPLLALAILIPATIVVANLMAYWPARSVARASIASILRAE